MRKIALFGALFTLFLSGCASYQLGEPTSLPYKSIAVAAPRNSSTLPQLEAALTSATRSALQQSGALDLATGSTSDAVLLLHVLEVRREIAAVNSNDVGRGRKFELEIDVELTLENTASPNSPFIDRRLFTIKQDVFTDSGLVDAEYQAMPEISRLVAERATEILTDRW